MLIKRSASPIIHSAVQNERWDHGMATILHPAPNKNGLWVIPFLLLLTFKMFSNILCCAGSGHVNPFSCIRNDIFVNVFLYVLSNSDWTMASDHSARRHLVSIEDHDLNSGGFVEVTCRCPYLLPRLAGVTYFMRAGQP